MSSFSRFESFANSFGGFETSILSGRALPSSAAPASRQIQTAKISHFPIIVVGKEYWHDVSDLMKKMVEAGTVSPGDLKLLYFTDSVEEIVDIIRIRAIKRFGLKMVKNRPWRILFER